MKLKDLGYALIGVFTATKKDKLEKELEEEVEKLHTEIKNTLYMDLQERIAENERKYQLRQHNFKTRGEAFRQIAENNTNRADHCNHFKGGYGLKGIVNGTGDSNQYAVIKHTHRNGDTHVHCLRCPKIWMPGDPDYYKALNFKTLNVASSDILVASRLEDGTVTGDYAEAFRKWTNVRPYTGIAFSPGKGITESTRLAEELQSTYPDQKRPATIRKELIPTLVKTEEPAEQNVKFNVVQNAYIDIS